MRSTVTAIVPTYNRAAFLDECLTALAQQTRPLAEIIIWDDGSTDDTADIAQAHGARFEPTDAFPAAGDLVQSDTPVLRYFKAENRGKSHALNRALQRARGEYVWVCDDDDLAMPEAVALLGARLDKNPALVAAAGSYERFHVEPDTAERITQGPGHWPDLSRGSVLRHLLEDMFIFQNATLARRSVFQQIGPFREDLARSVDYEMILRMAAHGPIDVIETPVFLQRQHEGDRGPAARRHSAADTVAVWQRSDADIFSRLYDSIPLLRYKQMFESPDADLVLRAAYLQRACVFARHDDWETAFDDLDHAARIKPDTGLCDVERRICRRMLSGKFAISAPVPADVIARLRRFAAATPAASEIVRAIGRGMVWRIRHALQNGVLRDAAATTASTALLWRVARKQGKDAPLPLRERSSLYAHGEMGNAETLVTSAAGRQ